MPRRTGPTRAFLGAAAAAWLACSPAPHDEPIAPPPPPPPAVIPILTLVSAPAADTISTSLADPIVVDLKEQLGYPLGNRALQFENANSDSTAPRVSFVLPGQAPVEERIAITDPQGRASVRIAYGTRAGTGAVTVRVTFQGSTAQLNVPFTITPGRPAGLGKSPRDTAVVKGKFILSPSTLVDRGGNPVSGPVALSTQDPLLSITGNRISGLEFGVASYLATGSGITDTVRVVIVPDGVLAGATESRRLNIVNTDGSNLRQLNVSALDWFSWSPDGQEVAFMGDPSPKTEVVGMTGPARPASATNSGFMESTPRYSPDGAFIYFSANDFTLYRVMRVRRDGTGLAFAPGMENVTAIDPSVSATGKLVYRDLGNQLWVRDLQSGATMPLGASGTSPVWSPDGTRIAYQAEGFAGSGQIWLIRHDGTGNVPLATNGQYVHSMGWSPDGQWIAALNFNIPDWRVELIRVSTGQILPLYYTDMARWSGVSWRP